MPDSERTRYMRASQSRDTMSFQAFDSFEEAQAAMRAAEARANERATEAQRAIEYGDHWLSTDGDLLIFGRVSTLEELDAAEQQLGVNQRERRQEQAMIEGAHARGYRFGWAYSLACPSGEMGSTHISMMVQITEHDFHAAESHHWNPLEIMECERCIDWLVTALRQGRDG
jgi:hypothetical protein